MVKSLDTFLWRRAETLLLVDDAEDRRAVLTGLLASEGYRLICCNTVAACSLTLLTSVQGVLAHVSGNERALLPLLERAYDTGKQRFTPLCLWSAQGMFDLIPYRAFLKDQQAVVFSLPLDVDALLGVVRLVSHYPGDGGAGRFLWN